VNVTQGRFGEIVEWSEDQAHRLEIVGLPRVSLVLGTQESILTSLLRICVSLRPSDPRNSRMGDETWKRHVERGFKHLQHIAAWDGTTKASFGPPKVVSLSTLAESFSDMLLDIDARRAELSSGIECLQCDPKQMRSFLQQLKPDSRKRKTAKSNQAEKEQDWSNVGFDVVHGIATQIGCYNGWTTISLLLKDILSFLPSVQEDPDSLLQNVDFLRGMQTLRHVLEGFLSALCEEFTMSSDMQYFLNNKQSLDLVSHGSAKTVSADSVRKMFEEDRVLWCLWRLGGFGVDPDSLYQGTLHIEIGALVFMLEEFISGKNITEKRDQTTKYLNRNILDRLHHIAGVYRVLHFIDSFRPHMSLDDLTPTQYTTSLLSSGLCTEKTKECLSQILGADLSWDILSDTLDSVSPTNQVSEDDDFSKWTLSTASFYTSFVALKLPQIRDHKWLECSTKQRSLMAEFWVEFRQHLSKLNVCFGAAWLISTPMDGLYADQTVSHKADVERERQTILESLERSLKALSFEPSVSTAHGHHTFDTKTNFRDVSEASKKAEKIKTRGQASVSIVEEAAVEDAPQHEDQLPTIPVENRRALEVFHLLYPGSDKEDRQRSLTWDEFIRAMSHIGFELTNNGGSVVSFRLNPSSPAHLGQSQEGKRINIHQPHPRNTMDEYMVRALGRRLGVHFGWTREMFVLVSET
jgi:hypothetical protein